MLVRNERPSCEGSFTAKPSLAVGDGGGDGGGVDVNVDMVIVARFWMDRGEKFNLDAELSAEATVDIEDKFFGVHLSGGASTACKPEGLHLLGTFWFMIPGVADSRLDGVLSVVKLCGDHFNGDDIPMLSAYVGIPEWNMGVGVSLKDLFVHVNANPGAGGENDVATFSWFGDVTGTIDMESGGLMPPGMGVFGEMSMTVSMAWGFNHAAGLTLGKLSVEASAKFVIGNAGHEDVRLEVDARFTIPCVAGDVIEANATLTVHAESGGANLLSIPGASVAVYVPCNMDPAPKDVVVMVTDRGPVTVVTPIASLEIIQIDFKIYGDKSMSGTIMAKAIDIEAMPNDVGQFAGSITFDTTSGDLFIDADFAWKNDFVRIRAAGKGVPLVHFS